MVMIKRHFDEEFILKQEIQKGLSDDLNIAHSPQYSPGSVPLRAVLRDLGRIEGQGTGFKFGVTLNRIVYRCFILTRKKCSCI